MCLTGTRPSSCACLPQYCEATRAKGYAPAIDLAEVSSEELHEIGPISQLGDSTAAIIWPQPRSQQ
jgi:hypothetical protein